MNVSRVTISLMVVMLALAACSLTESPAPATSPVAFPTPALPNTANAFNYDSLVGQAAPTFTLTDASGKAYSFTPSDGRKHLVVFYMGYV